MTSNPASVWVVDCMFADLVGCKVVLKGASAHAALLERWAHANRHIKSKHGDVTLAVD